jgi:hypothetical protein
MDKSQIQKGTKELLEKAEKPKEFTKGLQELLKSFIDKEATKNYQRIIPDTGKFFGVVTLRGYKKIQTTNKVFEILDLVMEDRDKDIKKAVSWILREITKKNPNEVAEFLTRWAKANPGKDTRWIIKEGMKKLPKEKQVKDWKRR